MKKILYRHAILEITRRCQLKCAHCLRGDAQNLDMSEEIIDAFLEQTAGIERLFFTGGEPTLAVDKMRYVLDQMIDRNIPLYAMEYFTNGVEFPENIEDFLIRAHEYITTCRENTYIFNLDPKMKLEPKISVGISLDNFHEGGNFEHTLSQYQHLFSGMSSCCARYVNNTIPRRAGRGNNLEYAVDESGYELTKNIAIGIAEKWNDVACDDYLNPEEMFERCDAFIPCQMCVTATGAITHLLLAREYTQSTEHICQIQDKHFPPIIDEIKKFNIGRTPCFLTSYTPHKITLGDALAFINFEKKHSINTVPNPLDSSNWNGLSWEEMIQLAVTLLPQGRHHLALYKAHLLMRVAKYDAIDEIKKDFPQSNNLFYNDVIKMREKFFYPKYYPKRLVEWICENKDEVKYRVEEDLIPLADQIGQLTEDRPQSNGVLLDALLRVKEQRESA